MPGRKPKAVVAMSGGVDSSVAAALMKEDGYEVTGIMLKLWKGEAANNESGCCSVDAAEDARRVAQVLDIPFYVLNFADQFAGTVIDNFKRRYAAGLTPNPCVECNRSIKFAALLDRARQYGAQVLATGHYARTDSVDGRHRLLRAREPAKDQSYVLYMLGQEELAMARFPVGGYSKPEIRSIAASLALRTANKPESQDLCFVPDGDTHAFLADQVPEGSVPGAIVTSDGRRLGRHRGFAHYTIGQRRGLGIGLGLPLYVTDIRPEDNTVVVAGAGQMQVQRIEVADARLVSGSPEAELRCTVMTRYRGAEAPAAVQLSGSRATVTFDEPQQRPAPGQTAVFYVGDEVAGGGTISRAADLERTGVTEGREPAA
ncbi:MAG TPA: tRNA 2-thiouridine(34) synthase MnmA [Actinomycetota bacterium]|nr:tRNA 2-thiouridine(34) synthase MnmA [Actinomycetota bacterium]